MLLLLVGFADQISAFNVFRYITFRTGGALITSALIVFLFGPAIINSLRIRQGKGQPIRADGPQTHFKTAGTPKTAVIITITNIGAAPPSLQRISGPTDRVRSPLPTRIRRAVRMAGPHTPSLRTAVISEPPVRTAYTR